MKLTLSKVKKNNCKTIFKIRNEKSVRLNSKNTNFINFNDHKKWFYKNYNLRKNYFFICKINNNSIGYVRYVRKYRKVSDSKGFRLFCRCKINVRSVRYVRTKFFLSYTSYMSYICHVRLLKLSNPVIA